MAEMILLILFVALAAFAAIAEVFGYDSRDHGSRPDLGVLR
jgi:hypothetical protein